MPTRHRLNRTDPMNEDFAMTNPTATTGTADLHEVCRVREADRDRLEAAAKSTNLRVSDLQMDAICAAVETLVAERVAAAVPLVRRALNDPGSFVARGADPDGVAYGERLDRWQERAVAHLLGTQGTPASPAPKGDPAQQANVEEMVPWAISPEHRWAYPLMMLRAESKRRAGQEVTGSLSVRLDDWLAMMERENTVVDYDPQSTDGFAYVTRTDDDTGLVRVPGRVVG
jgi:uncharacterized protein (DUF1778 family)